ncbi:hypothetical protein SH661x_001529 [Planctomicrobium sp. SH661]|uniref:hypothetical protein n=1 Tax=Planctomicrobium sp. SH661 TaxID=3448124 RepID=UPI003F5CB9E4
MKTFSLYLLAATLVLVPATGFAQRPVNTETRSGTVKEVIHKGRGRTLVVECDGEELSFVISPKVAVEVVLSGGDDSALQKGAYLEGIGTLTNNKLFLESAKVRLLPPNAKTPNSKMEKPEKLSSGQSLNSNAISGQIMARQTSKDYPEYEELALRPAPNVPVIMFQKNLVIDVVSSNIDDVKPDQTVELEVIAGRNDKLTLVRATFEGGEYVPPEPEAADKDKSDKK